MGDTENDTNLPVHVAIIMDGNGRWAKKRNLPRIAGHREGVKRVREIVEESGKIGIKYLTLYTFSKENWKRSKDEVSFLMKLFIKSTREQFKDLMKNNVRVRIIGDREGIPSDVLDIFEWIEGETENNTGLNLLLAVNYGGRDEILNAVKKLIEKGVTADKLTPEFFGEYLYTKDIPDPDLVIRTSGEIRISNFLLWQIAYSEFYFTNILWPDFTGKEYKKSIENYLHRKRRFGGI
ncbi:MAG: isoprenyl transferase [Proteobacteria bacterium]|nr:isoprenyl transferase [Pseudomonadota bacterium]